MLKVNGEIVNYGRFPDGTLNIKGDSSIFDSKIMITWHYENDAEYMALAFLTKYYQEHGNKVVLYLPYIPNARMDRVEEPCDIFTMKYFGEMINELNFSDVIVLDAHSSVAIESIKNCWAVTSMETFINKTIEIIRENSNDFESPLIFFPDEGSMKRYKEIIKIPYAYGVKNRDWKTGKILGLGVWGITPEEIKGKTVLIIDDICSFGGTFYYSAKKLKEMGAKEIDLYVTHCENNIKKGKFGEKKESLLDTGLINYVFTTDSIFTDNTGYENIILFKLHSKILEQL